MASTTLKLTYEALIAFRAPVPSDGQSERYRQLALNVAADKLIELAGKFAFHYLDAEGAAVFGPMAQWLLEVTDRESEFGEARNAAVQEMAIAGTSMNPDWGWLDRHDGSLWHCCRFPELAETYLRECEQILRAAGGNNQTLEHIRKYVDVLRRIVQTARTDSLWGGYLLGLCTDDYGEDLRKIFAESLAQISAAIQEAAENLYRRLEDLHIKQASPDRGQPEQIATPPATYPAQEPSYNVLIPSPVQGADPLCWEEFGFRSLCWYGEKFKLSPAEAACVQALWEEHKNGCRGLDQAEIIKAAGYRSRKLSYIFRSEGVKDRVHFLIVSAGISGMYRLWQPGDPREKDSASRQP